MTISTNYSKSDWGRAIPASIIYLIPVIILILSTFYLFIPYLNNFSSFLDFVTNDETVLKFVDYIKDNNLQNGLLKSQDGFVTFMFLMWFGGAIFPLLIIVKFQSVIPTDYIVKKLGLQSRMKLVVFKNGKPIHKVRDIFK